MDLKVVLTEGSYRLGGGGPIEELGNRYLIHLGARQFSPCTVRAYAYDLLNFSRFLEDRRLSLTDVSPSDLFDWLEWQSRRRPVTGKVVRFDAARGPAPATVNRRVAAVRGLFEYAVILGERSTSPVPGARRSTGWRAPQRGMLGHLGPGRERSGGRLVRQPRRLPESVDPADVARFIGDLGTHRDRAIALVMVLGGLRAGEARSLLLANVDMGLGRVRVTGKGGRERVVPVERSFFTETAAYLRHERPVGCATPQCFVVLRGPTSGQAMTEAGLRKIFRSHRISSGATRVRPHRLRHTYGTELAAAGVDLLVLRELMGHVSPETTARYVHLSADDIATEYAIARAKVAP
jgi:site-specific recombinase XerD